MKQNNTVQRSPKRRAASSRGPITIGLDLGDRSSRYCRLDGQGEVVQEASVATTKKGLQLAFGARPHCRIAIEVGTHSPWVSRLGKGQRDSLTRHRQRAKGKGQRGKGTA